MPIVSMRSLGIILVLPGLMFLALLICMEIGNHINPTAKSSESTGTSSYFSWEELPASKTLKWHNCYSGFQCARLTVPLDHSLPKGRKGAVALIRMPSAFPVDSESYHGPVLFNPGGPGISGVDQILGRGDTFRSIIGPEFDIVGFDPRGLGRSTPIASFFNTRADRALWYAGPGAVNTSDEGIGRTWARARVLGQLAAQNDDGSLRYFNTEQTVRDMLSIVEAHGQSKLQYWGFSYGTVLGVTFATLFPNKIERMILDGIVDADQYTGTKWSNLLVDTETIMELFYSECAKAGQELCAFWSPTAKEIRQNLADLYTFIKRRPIPVMSTSGHGLIDYDSLRFVIFKTLKNPYTAFQPLAQGLADLAAGDGRWVLEKFYQVVRAPFECSCNPTKPIFEVLDDGGTSILCNDYYHIPEGIEWAEDYYRHMLNDSPWGDVWSRFWMECQGWPKFPKTNFRGPFQGNTSHPILLVSNTLDPVTPLAGAHKMSSAFPGSVVLTQVAAGHMSISSPSPCTEGYIREYLINGTLPEPGTMCDVSATFFHNTTFNSQQLGAQYPFAQGMGLVMVFVLPGRFTLFNHQ